MIKRNLYDTAITLAKDQQYDINSIIDIHRKFGDHLYDKGHYFFFIFFYFYFYFSIFIFLFLFIIIIFYLLFFLFITFLFFYFHFFLFNHFYILILFLGDFDQAMKRYVETIGFLEPSYVIRRFLDAQRTNNLTTYLQHLHEKGLATSDHTTLLLNCYTKLKEDTKLNQFINVFFFFLFFSHFFIFFYFFSIFLFFPFFYFFYFFYFFFFF